jgi:myo-inositol-1(or 4)-monophosphatase
MCQKLARMDVVERVARAAVNEASTMLKAAWRGTKSVEYKSAVDLVTETDRAVEAAVMGRLSAAFPDHHIVAEESVDTATLAAPDEPDRYVWYLDPLDGTTNFAHAYPQFAISLALARGRDLMFGIVHDPIRDETFVAHHGGGARLNDEPIAVSSTAALNDALLATGFPYDRREHGEFYLGFFGDFMQRSQGIRRNGSAALDLCYVACGRLDGFWEWKLRPWDTAAGVLIVRESGGVVTNFQGGPFDLFAEQTLASNGRLHDAMATVLTTRLATAAPRVHA